VGGINADLSVTDRQTDTANLFYSGGYQPVAYCC